MSGSLVPRIPRPHDTSGLPRDDVLGGIGLLGLGGLALAAVHSLTGGQVGIPCPLRVLTGIACPACGATRAAAALLHGDLGAALQFNAPVLVAGVVVAYLWTAWVLQRFGVVRLPRPGLGDRARRALLPVLVALALVWMLLRNLPWEPFTALYV